VLGTTEEVWKDQFQKMNKDLQGPPHLELYSDQVNTGLRDRPPPPSAPFYCPADQKVYIDPTFFDELERKYGGSKAAFSQAYVIAHEVGHQRPAPARLLSQTGNDGGT